MNERILELADKAVEDMPSGPWNIPDEFCKKFAELIVRECAQLVKNTQLTEDGHTWRSADYVVLEHFGVKE
jgi:hypothetical protein